MRNILNRTVIQLKKDMVFTCLLNNLARILQWILCLQKSALKPFASVELHLWQGSCLTHWMGEQDLLNSHYWGGKNALAATTMQHVNPGFLSRGQPKARGTVYCCLASVCWVVSNGEWELTLQHWPNEVFGAGRKQIWGPEGQKKWEAIAMWAEQQCAGWSSGPCVPSWLPPSPFGMTLKSLLMLPANVIIFPPWVVLRSTPGKDLRGWRWMLFQQRARTYLLVLPSSMRKAVRVLLWQALSHSERKRCPVPKASTTAHRVTVLLQLISSSLIQLNSACIILLLFM